jgi:hypothetical protein
VPAAAGVVMLSPPTASRNAEGAHCEGRAKGESKKRGQRQYKGRSPKAPPEVLEDLASLQRGSLILREDCYNVVT